MIIERKSPLTGKINQMDLPVTEDQIHRWQNGNQLIQHAFPHLTGDQREFLMSGYTPEDWAKIFPPEEERDFPTFGDEPAF